MTITAPANNKKKMVIGLPVCKSDYTDCNLLPPKNGLQVILTVSSSLIAFSSRYLNKFLPQLRSQSSSSASLLKQWSLGYETPALKDHMAY